MNILQKAKDRPNRSEPYFWSLTAAWSVVLVVSLIWNIHHGRQDTLEAAHIQAEIAYNKDVIYRRWNAEHGGVYVPVNEKTQPNPHLDVPERDITTPSGRKLTLMNPAYMTRQVHELGAKTYGVRGHITSLRPIRPKNAPDPWEAQALEAIQRGAKEFSSVEAIEGQDYMRLMRPLLTEEACMKCHAAQGYKVGDIRGGISVSVPMAPLWTIERSHILSLSVAHGLLLLFGIGGINFGTRRLRQRIRERDRAEQALRKNEEKLDAMLRSIGDHMSMMDKDLNIIWANETAQKIFGNDIIGKKCFEAYHGRKEPCEPYPCLTLKAFEDGKTHEHETQVIDRDGKIVHFHCTANVALRDKEGKPTAVIEISRDITTRKQAEAALRESEEKFRCITASAKDAIIMMDNEGNISYWNEAAEEIFGYSAQEALGNELHMFLAPRQYHEAYRKSIGTFKTTGQGPAVGKTLELEAVKKDGTIFPIGLSVSSVKIKGRWHAIGILRDITDRKRAEAALQKAHYELEERVEERTVELQREVIERKHVQEQIRKSKTMLQEIFDGISDPLIMVGKDMSVNMLNRPAAEYYQVELRNAVGKPCYQAFRGRSAPCEGCDIPSAVSRGEAATFERKGMADSDRFEQVVIYPLKEKEGEGGAAIVRISDITEAKLLERQVIRSEKMASLGLLVSGIAHEINNPNNFITFNIPIMRDYLKEVIPILDDYARVHPDFELFGMSYPEFREDIFKLLDNIEHGSSRINAIVSDLREFSRRKDKGERRLVDLKQVFEQGVAICRGEIRKKVKSFEINIPEDLPKIFTDPEAVGQALVNLLINAVHAADKEDSWIRLNVALGHTRHDHLIIEVSDNGCGMDEKTMEKIFDPFFTTKPVGTGTGLGLYVCHSLVEGLGGRIEVESEVGEGSMFRVALPGN